MLNSKVLFCVLLGALEVTGTAACGDAAAEASVDAKPERHVRDAGTEDERPDASPVGDAGMPAPLYIGATRVFTEDSSRGYMFAISSLDADTKVDLKQAVEMDDAWVFGSGDPYFYTATIFSPTITRWTITDAGKFEKGPVVSFANEGVEGTYTAAFVPIYSANKSYFVDSTSAQVVVWDPQKMELIDTIPIPIDGDGLDTGLSPTMDISLRDDRVFVSVFWMSEDSGWTKYGPFTRIVAIDANTDEVLEVNDDTRCETLAPGGVTSDGITYFSPWDYHTTVRAVFGKGFGAKSCALHIVPKGLAFDQGYEVDVGTLVGGKPAGSLKLIDDEHALIHVWNSGLVDATPKNWSDTRFEPGYTWYRWTIGESTATELPDQQPSTEGGEWHEIDGSLFMYNSNDDYSKTTLFELLSSGELRKHLTVPGWTVQLIRVR